jgi:glucosyl-dolichyl phosphate glucuronosyltransferase
LNNIYISVIIPTRNRAELLEKTLDSIRNQSYPQDKFELIVVDNGSSDNTSIIALNNKGHFLNYITIFEKNPGLHMCRHAGLKASRGSILVYIDDDVEVFPCWLEGIAESFQDSKVVLVGGNNLPKYELTPPPWNKDLWNSTPWGKVNPIYSLLDFGNYSKKIPPIYIWGCNFAIRKSILLEAGGFHPDGMPENLLKYRGDGETSVSEYIIKKGYEAQFNPKASVLHWVSKSRMSYAYIFKRGYIQGITSSYTRTRKNGQLRPIEDNIFLINLYLRKKFVNAFKILPEPLRIYSDGHLKGYMYHQNELRIDKFLITWVVSKDYIDGNIRSKLPY